MLSGNFETRFWREMRVTRDLRIRCRFVDVKNRCKER